MLLFLFVFPSSSFFYFHCFPCNSNQLENLEDLGGNLVRSCFLGCGFWWVLFVYKAPLIFSSCRTGQTRQKQQASNHLDSSSSYSSSYFLSFSGSWIGVMGMAAEPQFHVLAVDDSLIDRKLIEKLLKNSSFQGTFLATKQKVALFHGIFCCFSGFFSVVFITILRNYIGRLLSYQTNRTQNQAERFIHGFAFSVSRFCPVFIYGYSSFGLWQ